MKKYKKYKKTLDYIFIIIGTTLIALAINLFFESNELVTGGVTGLAIIIKYISNNKIPLWATNIVVNIPLFIIGTFLKGKGFVGKTLFSTFYLSFALYYTRFIPIPTNDLLLSSIFGGILGGAGLGIVFYANATTGGTDLAASILKLYFKHINIGTIMVFIDGIIIILGTFVFGIEKAMYAIISIYITGKIVDNILEGIHFSKVAFIISEHSEIIANELMSNINRGVTSLNGKGMYTKDDKQVLFCVVSKKQIVVVKEIVKEIDSSAFVIVADVREVLGEGFSQYLV